ncbi:MAG TPA: hypothetical protein PLW81_02770 [Thiobacillaceae bacterium]|nr:hypothetical protein [Thiobacillaceae bacterium]
MAVSDDTLHCWRCGEALVDQPLPLGRLDECPACHAQLHVCRMCRHYDTGKAKQCREPVAEPVQDKIRANFCDWFQPRVNLAPVKGAGQGATARAALDDLFGSGRSDGGSDEATDAARDKLEDLFKP